MTPVRFDSIRSAVVANPTFDQRRAKHAWTLVRTIAGQDEAAQREFQLHAKRMPLRILASGLGQTLAFLDSRDVCRELRAALADWVASSGLAEVPSEESDDLMDWIVWGDSAFLRLATRESLAYLEWVVQFSDSFIAVSELDEDGNADADH